MRVGRSCVACGARTSGASRCPAHTPTLTHGDTEYQRNRALAKKRDGYACTHCGATGVPLEVDHVIPLRDGGTHDLDQLRTLCRRCHALRTIEDR